MMKTIQQFHTWCLQENYPIMANESLDKILELTEPNSCILECGTCVGYSAIYMARHNRSITSIERDLERHTSAIEWVQEFNLNDRIKLIYDDALVYQPDKQYDAILIDASKAHNYEYFERYYPYVKRGGHLIFDNMSFHGHTEHIDEIYNRNLRRMVSRIKSFQDEIMSRDDLKVQTYPLGDGLLVITKV